ncbi:putative Acrosin [Hypsibius exemplaris]|uniref:Acrosin n=1 Tax=Hypsibius exemplaris TaxID=2072580 RepID=A0A1W0WTC7_HYPEX|nr:putative Acrosin [Hypsibius exemplaris]
MTCRGLQLILCLGLLSRLSQSQNCDGSLFGSGTFQYPPNYPGNYPDYAECRWTITGPPNNVIQVQFHDSFGIPGRDFLIVVDGQFADRLGPACDLSGYFALGQQGVQFILIRANRADFASFTSTTNSVVAIFCAQGQRGSFIPRIGFRGRYFSIPKLGGSPSGGFIPPTPITQTQPPPIIWTQRPLSPVTFPPIIIPQTVSPFTFTPPPLQWTAPSPVTLPPTQPPPSTTCGMPIRPPVAGRIIGGNPALLGSWPWMVALVDSRYNGQFCGGILVDEFWVLTAAHCIVDKASQNLILRIGATDFNATVGDPKRGVDYTAAFTIIQPSYDGNSFTNDLAMIRLSRAVTFSNYVKPVCLPSLPPQDGLVCYIAGYGLTTPMQRKKRQVNVSGSGSNLLMETDIPLVGQTTCQNFFNQAFPGLIKLTNSHVCAGSVYPIAKDSCNGDSGGPLVCRRPSGRYEVVGLTSFGVGCGRSDVFGAYTNVWALLSWINSIRGLTIGK